MFSAHEELRVAFSRLLPPESILHAQPTDVFDIDYSSTCKPHGRRRPSIRTTHFCPQLLWHVRQRGLAPTLHTYVCLSLYQISQILQTRRRRHHVRKARGHSRMAWCPRLFSEESSHYPCLILLTRELVCPVPCLDGLLYSMVCVTIVPLPSESFLVHRPRPFPPRWSTGQEPSVFPAGCFSHETDVVGFETCCLRAYIVLSASQDQLTNLHASYVARVYAASTCTSVTVSDVGLLDGTYEYQSSGYYTRATGTVTYEIQAVSGFWWIGEDTYSIGPFYRVSRGGWCAIAPEMVRACRDPRERDLCGGAPNTLSAACADSDKPRIPAPFLHVWLA